MQACKKSAQETPNNRAFAESRVRVAKSPDGIIIDTPHAQFTVTPNGYISASLISNSRQSSLENAGATTGLRAIVNGERVEDFDFSTDHATISEVSGNLGSTGKRVELEGRSKSQSLTASLRVDVSDDFPQLAVVSASLRNSGNMQIKIERFEINRHEFDASKVDASVRAHQMWSFHGASIEWGKDNVFEIPQNFSQRNQMGSLVEVNGDLGRVGGGIPVVAFWTRSVGEAIGHLETLPLVLSIPVRTESNDRVSASVEMEPAATLGPGESYSTPRTFVEVYAGDYYDALQMYSDVIDREGLKKVTNTAEDYAVSWCGWGYLSDVTPKQMLATIPMLKRLGIHWATLDDRWFNNYGDWQARSDTFPGDSLVEMVKRFHTQGIKVQLWWLPLAVEDGGLGYESHSYGMSAIVKQHPDWLILDKQGRPASMTRNLATLCPALPEVRNYYRQLVERFIRDWDFDGNKLDNIYSVPLCYNPKHHHKSPLESVYAMGEVYKTIFETTRKLKPESVTQSCPCGTPPSIAWLRDMDQAVAADPVGSVQVRQRIKMYKALLGPYAAVYGDHVELTRIADLSGNEKDLGSDFASTLGTGGVLGTKFTWPENGPKYQDVYLTPAKQAHWKKWITLYNEKMLSRGNFKNLYIYGYSVPEAYAIEKDGAMYYAFFAPESAKGPRTSRWSGDIELKGLPPGQYDIIDYVDGHDFGLVTAPDARLRVDFKDHLLLEATKR